MKLNLFEICSLFREQISFLVYFYAEILTMTKLKAWISAARLRTLPLSVSGILVGASLGHTWQFESGELFARCFGFPSVFDSPMFWLAILTTIGFQVLSNFANDYGDGVKGADKNREGEKRMVASGLITPTQMKIGMVLMGLFTFLCASSLVFMAFGFQHLLLSFLFFNLGIISIVAAIKYTVGKKAYGYSGFGDVFVFLFFGLLSTLGSYVLFTKTLNWDMILPAFSIGCFSMAVLNLNNMRDIVSDARVGKNTMVVKMGSEKAKKYHYFLLSFGMICALAYTGINFRGVHQFSYIIAFIPLLLNIRTVMKNREPRLLDSELKKVALSTFLFAILFSYLH